MNAPKPLSIWTVQGKVLKQGPSNNDEEYFCMTEETMQKAFATANEVLKLHPNIACLRIRKEYLS